MSIEERIGRLERLEKLRYNLKGLVAYGWDETTVIKDLEFKNISTFKETIDTIKEAIATIQYSM